MCDSLVVRLPVFCAFVVCLIRADTGMAVFRFVPYVRVGIVVAAVVRQRLKYKDNDFSVLRAERLSLRV